MKYIYRITFALVFSLMSCETETLKENTTVDQLNLTGGAGGNAGLPNEIIVRYDPTATAAERQAMRDQFGVLDYKNCNCADPDLELWIFETSESNGSAGNIEEKVIVIKDDDGVEDAAINRAVQHNGQHLDSPFGPSDIAKGIEKVKTDIEGVTIAVLDTGIDYNYFGFAQPFLYNTVGSGDYCMDNGNTDYFGWDFVNEDNDPYDDYGHGTIISSMIASRLQSNNVDFQILPIKVFDNKGKGTYFDILCGFKYAANNKHVNIINMSFGWSDAKYRMLDEMVHEYQDKALLTTSAGNSTMDNDIFPHYPSSYDTPNVLSNAALADLTMGIQLAWFSNKGTQSVDIAAPGTNLPFYLSGTEIIPLNGTSYSNAIISAYAGSLYQDGMTPAQLRNLIIQNATYHTNLDDIQYSSYILY